MGSVSEDAEVNQAQRTYARLAGFLLLAIIILALGSDVILSRIAGSGSFAETAIRIAAFERAYRVALSCVVIVSLTSLLLAFALYVTVKPLNSLLAQLGMIFSLADSFLGLVVRMCSFVRLHLYVSARDTGSGLIPAELLSDFVRTIAATTENIGGISFGIGSCLFSTCFSHRNISRE
jgi:hypothetical protein